MTESKWTGNDPLRIERSGPVARLIINRPEKRNAIAQHMWRDIPAIVAEFEDDNAIKAVIITGNGPDFSVGADIGEFDQLRKNADTARAYEAANSAAFTAVRTCQKPTIAAIRGNCLGGGFGLAAACDLRIATADAMFSVPAAKLGLAYPQDAMIDIVSSLGVQLAKYMLFSAVRIDATTARDAGFLLEVVDAEVFAQRIEDLAGTIATNAPLSIRAAKSAIAANLSGRQKDIDTAKALGAVTFESKDYDEGRRAFRERRPPAFTGE